MRKLSRYQVQAIRYGMSHIVIIAAVSKRMAIQSYRVCYPDGIVTNVYLVGE